MSGATKQPCPIGRDFKEMPSPSNSFGSNISGSPASTSSNVSSCTSVESLTTSESYNTSNALHLSKTQLLSKDPNTPSPSSSLRPALSTLQTNANLAPKDISNPQNLQYLSQNEITPDNALHRSDPCKISSSCDHSQVQPLTKGAELKLVFAKERAKREAARGLKKEHEPEFRTLPDMQAETKLAEHAKAVSELVVAATHKMDSPSFLTAEQVLAEIKRETADNIKSVREEREQRQINEEKRMREGDVTALGIQSPGRESLEEMRKRLAMRREKLAQEQKQRDNERAAREAENAARHEKASGLRLVAWSPVVVQAQCPTIQCEEVVFENEGDEYTSSPEAVDIGLAESPDYTSGYESEMDSEEEKAQHLANLQAVIKEVAEIRGSPLPKPKFQSFLPRPIAKVNFAPMPPGCHLKYPPIQTGFERYGVYLYDARNGTPDRCFTSYGEYLTYPLDNENYEETSRRSKCIQTCLEFFGKQLELSEQRFNFGLDFEPGPMDHHRSFKHDHISIANTEGPLPNHHRRMSFLNSRYTHDPESCWQCHRARFQGLKTIWEDERDPEAEYYFDEEESFSDVTLYQSQTSQEDLYDEDGFLIEYDDQGFLIEHNITCDDDYEESIAESGLDHPTGGSAQNHPNLTDKQLLDPNYWLYGRTNQSLQEEHGERKEETNRLREEQLHESGYYSDGTEPYDDDDGYQDGGYHGPEICQLQPFPEESFCGVDEGSGYYQYREGEGFQGDIRAEYQCDHQKFYNEHQKFGHKESSKQEQLYQEDTMVGHQSVVCQELQMFDIEEITNASSNEYQNMTAPHNEPTQLATARSSNTHRAQAPTGVGIGISVLSATLLFQPNQILVGNSLQRYFSTLLADLARANLCSSSINSQTPSGTAIPLATRIDSSSLGTSKVPATGIVATVTHHGRLPAPHMFLSRAAQEETGYVRSPLEFNPWLLTTTLFGQIIIGIATVGNGFKSLFKFGKATQQV